MPKPKPPQPHISLTKNLIVMTVVSQRTTFRVECSAQQLVVSLNELADKLRRKRPLTDGGEELLAEVLEQDIKKTAYYLESLASRIRRRRKLSHLDEYAIGLYLLGQAAIHLRPPW